MMNKIFIAGLAGVVMLIIMSLVHSPSGEDSLLGTPPEEAIPLNSPPREVVAKEENPPKEVVARDDSSLEGDVVSVYDGDTFKINLIGVDAPDVLSVNLGIRLAGVDTPEIRGAKCDREKRLAYQARDFVKSKILGKRILLQNCKRGKYFRLVCQVNTDEGSLTDLLIRKGLGYPYYGRKKDKYRFCTTKR
ncbi:MAG: thermonuclease family protein [Cytophagales bacterium]|nr:thermonuclease family protein [Cytophagales bacterium]